MKPYVKPLMKRNSLLSEKKIANTCWGWHHKSGCPTWWYDKNGASHGFVSFYIGAGSSCGQVSDLVHVTWYQNRDALNNGEGYEVYAGQTVTTDYGATVKPFDDTVAYLITMGGAEGNPFSGENNLIQDDEGMS